MLWAPLTTSISLGASSFERGSTPNSTWTPSPRPTSAYRRPDSVSRISSLGSIRNDTNVTFELFSFAPRNV